MRYKIAALTVATFALLATACGSDNDTVATKSVPKAPTTTMSIVDMYVSSVQPWFPGASRSALIDIGKTTCDTIDAFGSVSDMIFMIAIDPTWSVDYETTGFVIGAAIPTFCPEYIAELNALTS